MPLSCQRLCFFQELEIVMTQPDLLRRFVLTAAFSAAAPSVVRAQSATPNLQIRLALIEGMSGAFANTGEAVFRNLVWATERVNKRGGVKVNGSMRRFELLRFDSEGNTEKALGLARAAMDDGVTFLLQGNSSATAAALIDAVDKHNERQPGQRAIYLNYSAVEPSLTNERCSPWHFRFDAHADMRLAALTDVMREDKALKKVYLLGQDYSFGQHVVKQARVMLAAKRPDIEIVGAELHPLGRIKDFLPYATKIQASGAQAVVTGNWGNDLTLLVKAMREVGATTKFYTFYGNALGAPAAIGEAGVGAVYAVAEWHPNVGGTASDAFYANFRQRFAEPKDDYVHLRMNAMIEMLAQAIERASSVEAAAVSKAMSGAVLDARHLGLHSGVMRAADHQFQQPLVVSVMDRVGAQGVKHDVEGSGFGFRTVRSFTAGDVEAAHSCKMARVD
jgi:branched-chain amino acid transport system substrate-binding protein